LKFSFHQGDVLAVVEDAGGRDGRVNLHRREVEWGNVLLFVLTAVVGHAVIQPHRCAPNFASGDALTHRAAHVRALRRSLLRDHRHLVLLLAGQAAVDRAGCRALSLRSALPLLLHEEHAASFALAASSGNQHLAPRSDAPLLLLLLTQRP
jgi:hypothetical protein